jgi:hypothetical protein
MSLGAPRDPLAGADIRTTGQLTVATSRAITVTFAAVAMSRTSLKLRLSLTLTLQRGE